MGDICEQFNCNELAVKYALEGEQDFSDEDCRQMAAVIRQIAINGDNERNRLTAATYIYDVKKGLRVPKKEAPTISAVQINQLIIQAQQDVYRFIGSPSPAGKSEGNTPPPDFPSESPKDPKQVPPGPGTDNQPPSP